MAGETFSASVGNYERLLPDWLHCQCVAVIVEIGVPLFGLDG
jgi:hypothetical protein